MKEIYLDHAATTPVDPKVKLAMLPFLGQAFGNPSSLYKKGRQAKSAIDSARMNIAKIINSRPEEIIFTAGGTESDNLAIFGSAKAYRQKNKTGGHIITSQIEHHAVLEPCQQLQQEGFEITYLKVDKEGFINLSELKNSIRPDTFLVSIMYANNEVGTIEPIAEIGKVIRGINQVRTKSNEPEIIFHTDACQAAGVLNLNVQSLGLDLMTVNGSKIYGPKQLGFLFVRNGTNIKPLIYGGGQEKALRSGTENVAGIAGLAKALELVQKNAIKENKRLIALRDYFINKVNKIIPDVVLNGSKTQRLPNNIHLTVKGAEGEALMLYLDAKGIYISTGSACNSSSGELSHVLMSMGVKPKDIHCSIRITLGKSTNKKDLDFVLKTLAEASKMLRGLKQIN